MTAWRYQGPYVTEAVAQKALDEHRRMPLYLLPHPCTGDHIICAGLYRVLAKDWQLNIIIRPGMHRTVCLLLQGIEDACTIEMPEHEMVPYCDSLKDAVVLRIGFNSGIPFDQWSFDREFYRHAGVDFAHRWDSFKSPEIEQLPKPEGEYAFVHDRPDFFNAKLDMAGQRPIPEAHIFAHREIVLGAKALHCVSSSFAAFADSYDLNGKDLNFYPFGREIPTHRNKWKIHT